MKMKKIITNRGFKRVEFKDGYGKDCLLQKSSAAMGDFIWLGQSGEPERDHVTGRFVPQLMHLSQTDVKNLLPSLQHFADTGDLP